MCSELVRVRVAGASEALLGNLEDISASGACVQLEEPVQPGAALTLICRRTRFTGTAKYCVYVPVVGYLLGMAFDGGQKWSREEFVPSHLLDPAALKNR